MEPEIKSKLNSLEYKLIDLEVKLNKIIELIEMMSPLIVIK